MLPKISKRVKGLLYYDDDGQVDVREDYHHHTDWKQVQERLLEVLSPDGTILYRNERLGDRTIGGPPFAGEGVHGYSGRTAKMSDGTPIILISRQYDLRGQTILIRVGYSQDLIWNRAPRNASRPDSRVASDPRRRRLRRLRHGRPRARSRHEDGASRRAN